MRGENRRTSEADRAIGARVRTYRLTAGLSQTDLANRLGVTFQQVQKYENGKNRISAGKVCAIAEALKVRPDQILGTKGGNHRGTGIDPLSLRDHWLNELLITMAKLPANRRRAIVEALRIIVAAMGK